MPLTWAKPRENWIHPDILLSLITLEYNHMFDWENTKILDIEHNYNKRLIMKMIYIKKQENDINCKKDAR